MLKNDIENDIDSIIMNENDFAEYHDLNGVRALAIVEALTIKDKLAIKSASFEGYYQKKVIVHVKQADLNEIPVYGQRFILDGEIYSVDACDDDMGLLTIALVTNDI